MQVAAASGLVDDLEGRTLRLEDFVAMHAADAGSAAGKADGKTAAQQAEAAVKSAANTAKKLGGYLTPVEFVAGEVLHDFGDPADSIVLVMGGSLVSVLDFLTGTECAPSIQSYAGRPDSVPLLAGHSAIVAPVLQQKASAPERAPCTQFLH